MLDIVSDAFRDDRVIAQIRNTDLVIGAVYIPPVNSAYDDDDIYFENLKLIRDHFKSSHLIIAGDFNCRVSSLYNVKPGYNYLFNLDTTKNSNGTHLLEVCNDKPDVFILDGLTNISKKFDSNFTFFHVLKLI